MEKQKYTFNRKMTSHVTSKIFILNRKTDVQKYYFLHWNLKFPSRRQTKLFKIRPNFRWILVGQAEADDDVHCMGHSLQMILFSRTLSLRESGMPLKGFHFGDVIFPLKQTQMEQWTRYILSNFFSPEYQCTSTFVRNT